MAKPSLHGEAVPLLAEAASNRFNPAQMPMTKVIERDVTTFQPRMISASTNDFENAALYPEFILQSIWYDELPPQQGPVWGGVPPASVWNNLATHGAVRNLLGRPSTVAYRTDASQPFHYITRSYDERGRVECILRPLVPMVRDPIRFWATTQGRPYGAQCHLKPEISIDEPSEGRVAPTGRNVTRNLKPETQNPKPKTQNLKPKT